MTTAKILHDTAMDFYDMAKIAKAKGQNDSHDEYMKKALVIEKEAALKLPEDQAEGFWPYAYLRTAAWMALHLKQFDEAKLLVQLALMGQPSALEQDRLEEVLKVIRARKGDSSSKISDGNILTGFLISVDLSQRQIIVQTADAGFQNLILPQQIKIAPYLLGHMVTVYLKPESRGKRIIEDIRLAA